jgi:hypothetical protein
MVRGNSTKDESTKDESTKDNTIKDNSTNRNNPKDDDQSDFCVVGSAPEHRLSQFERLTLTGGRELDRALAHIGRHVLLFSSDESLAPFDPVEVARVASVYDGPGGVADLERFFPSPRGGGGVIETTVHGLRNGEILDLSFPSGYVPRDRVVAAMFQAHPHNEIVHARWWRHHGGAPATIVAVHGWTMGDQRLNSLAFLPGMFFRLGLDVVLFELPFHGRRRGTGSAVASPTGFLFPSTDLALTNEAMFQAVADLRLLKRYLGERGAHGIGTIGMSLGAYVGALWSACDDLAFAIPVVPLVSMGELAWEIVSRNPRFKAREAGVTPELLGRVLGVHCPLTYPARIPTDRALILAALGDHLVPRHQPERLWEHWGRPTLEWVSGGHDTLFQRSVAGVQVARFFDRLGSIKLGDFADLPPTP